MVRAANAERRCGFRRGPLLPTSANLLGQALGHVHCYVPRNTTRASTAFPPDLARRAVVRALTQAAAGTAQSQSDKKIR